LRGFLAVFFVGGSECAMELAGDVGEDRSTAGGDTVLREKNEERFKEAVEAIEGVQILWVVGEFGSEVVGLEVFGEFGVAGAETGIGVSEPAAATASALEEMSAAGVAGRIALGTLWSGWGWFLRADGIVG
jgi:hypothetical protein